MHIDTVSTATLQIGVLAVSLLIPLGQQLLHSVLPFYSSVTCYLGFMFMFSKITTGTLILISTSILINVVQSQLDAHHTTL